MKHSDASAPRILFLDDNVRDIGGHYLELASLLADGARLNGYTPELVTHHSFLDRNPRARQDPRIADLAVDSRFRVRRMENWSLGVDGASQTIRDIDGRPRGSGFANWQQRARDLMCRGSRRPSAMVNQWAEDFAAAVRAFGPSGQDRVVINTGGDFQMLALVSGLQQLSLGFPLHLHVIFHFAVYDAPKDPRAEAFGRQVQRCCQMLGEHDLRLHATTHALRQQLEDVGVKVSAIPYPTREPQHSLRRSKVGRKKIVLAGIPRAEKGKTLIHQLLTSLEHAHLGSGRFQCSMQMPAKRWESMVPVEMHDDYVQSLEGPSLGNPLEIKTGNLSCDEYHQWLDSADVGLFLYDPDRYVARCSGVLLEMLIRGVPCIVPANCWLATKVEEESVHGRVGYTFESIDEIPGLLDLLESNYDAVRENCRNAAHRIRQQHSPGNTLVEMGVAFRVHRKAA